MSEKIIEVENLSFAICAKQILNNITFSVSHGRKLFIVGPNGAGKTTLLRCIAKIITSWAGSIKIKNKDLRSYSYRSLAKILTYLPQSLPVDIPFTVREFILMARYPHLSPFSIIKPTDEEIVNRAMEMTETTYFADRSLSTLSGGERQRVCIAAAIAQQAEILLLDEPATYLDYKHQRDIYALLTKINKANNITVICVSHDLNSAVMNADEIIALKDGKIAFWGSAAEIMNEEILEKVYSKFFNLVKHPITNQKIIVPDVIE